MLMLGYCPYHDTNSQRFILNILSSEHNIKKWLMWPENGLGSMIELDINPKVIQFFVNTKYSIYTDILTVFRLKSSLILHEEYLQEDLINSCEPNNKVILSSHVSSPSFYLLALPSFTCQLPPLFHMFARLLLTCQLPPSFTCQFLHIFLLAPPSFTCQLSHLLLTCYSSPIFHLLAPLSFTCHLHQWRQMFH